MKHLSAMYCEHANENPHVCRCLANCYCRRKGGTCEYLPLREDRLGGDNDSFTAPDIRDNLKSDERAALAKMRRHIPLSEEDNLAIITAFERLAPHPTRNKIEEAAVECQAMTIEEGQIIAWEKFVPILEKYIK